MSSIASIRAIFWDNDGLLVDTERLYFRATADVLAEVGIALDEEAFHRHFLVESAGAWHLASARGASPETVAHLRSVRNARYADLLQRNDLVVDGAKETLSRLVGRFVMGLVTSSRREHLELIHRSTGLLRLFDFVLAREDYGRSKPDPEPYRLAVARSRALPQDCLVVEDSERGLRAATAAGLRCWVVPNALTRRGEFGAAERVLERVSQVADALLSAPAPGTRVP